VEFKSTHGRFTIMFEDSYSVTVESKEVIAMVLP
jgi:hypothetical protein